MEQFLRLIIVLLGVCAVAAVQKPSPYGKCHNSRRCKSDAQSGYTDSKGNRYCKPCFRTKFPQKCASKQAGRKKQCHLCHQERELIAGVCKPCRRSRSCESCGQVNMDPAVPRCISCSAVRESFGAKVKKLSLWCPACTTPDERHSGYCRTCFASPKKPCSVCHAVMELVEGVCAACRSARTCANCNDVNLDPDAQQSCI